MALATYEAKRKFESTPEPKGGGPTPTGRSFVVQMHAARRLHYDFRLEHEGVLLSWAVTRGPSSDPGEKRLAVRTEDHPIDYGGFEGIIPEGYGKGTVMLWDRGEWEPLHDVGDGLREGMLHFRLHGARMRGGWALIRMKGRRKGDANRENWLLVKEKDGEAKAEPDALTEGYTTSIATGRDLDAIAEGKPAVEVKRGTQPKFRAPMLATLVEAAPGEDWLFEPKLDGYRAEIALGRGGAVVYSRSGQDWTDRFAGIAAAAEALPVGSALIDGEVLAQGDETFSGLQRALSEGRALVFYAFDLLSLDGSDLTKKPLTERRAALEALLAPLPPRGALRLTPQLAGNGQAMLDALCSAGGEGVIAKRPDAAWRGGRSRAWLKIKCQRRAELVIGGYTKSEAKGRPFASLLLGTHDGGALVYRGKVGTGFDAAAFERLAPVAAARRKTSPFATLPAEARRDAVFVEPEAVAEVRYSELTSDGILRHASFQGLREDKAAAEVTGEELAIPPAAPDTRPTGKRPASARAASAEVRKVAERARKAGQKAAATGRDRGGGENPAMDSGRSASLTVAGVKISSSERVVFPDTGLTKGGLAEYYGAVAPRLLDHAKDRPLSLIRCPDGIAGQCFFQKHGREGFPDSVPRWKDRGEEWLYLNGARALLAAVQMGSTEFHIQGVRRDKPDRPDRVVLDLDPDEGLDFAAVRTAALELRELIEGMGLACGVMVTGGKGLHVVVPLKRTQALKTVALFAQTLATLMADRAPERFTANIRKARREGRIFVDWQRNTRGATAICPWSVRARPGARVALPLTWDELADVESGNAFDTAAALERAEKPDPLAGLTPGTLTAETLEGLGAK